VMFGIESCFREFTPALSPAFNSQQLTGVAAGETLGGMEQCITPHVSFRPTDEIVF
jgi:hypothetical protein